MGPLLVTAGPLLEALTRLDGAPAELSIAAGAPGAGVLVPVVDQRFPAVVARLWGREAPPWDEPSDFLRFDLRGSEWSALTWYRGARAADFVSPVDGAPVGYVARRWRRGGDEEVSEYIQVAGIAPEALPAAARAVGIATGLDEDAVRDAERICGRLGAIGWTQALGAVRGRRARLKITVATSRTEDALAVLAGEVDAGAVRARFRRIRSRLAYAGFTVERDGRPGLRLYARPVLSREVGFLLRAVS